MEIVAAVALTCSASMTWVALRQWSHVIVAPTLIYLGSALSAFATYRWLVFFTDTNGTNINLYFITLVQVGIILVMWSGKRFHDAAHQRLQRFEGQE